MQDNDVYAFRNQDKDEQMMLQALPQPSLQRQSHRYRLAWRDDEVELARGDEPMANLVTRNTKLSFPRHPDRAEGLSVGFSAQALGGECLDDDNSVRVEWVMLRKAAPQVPEFRLLSP